MSYIYKRAALPTDAIALEHERGKLVKALGADSDTVRALDAHRDALVSKAQGKEQGWTKGFAGKEKLFPVNEKAISEGIDRARQAG